MPGPGPPAVCSTLPQSPATEQHTPRPPVASSREGCRPRPVPPQGAQPMEWHTAFWSGCALANGFQEPTSHMCTLRSSPARGQRAGAGKAAIMALLRNRYGHAAQATSQRGPAPPGASHLVCLLAHRQPPRTQRHCHLHPTTEPSICSSRGAPVVARRGTGASGRSV